jgi:hypothetical protein
MTDFTKKVRFFNSFKIDLFYAKLSVRGQICRWMKVSPLYSKVERDRNKVIMAYMLGRLLDVPKL